MFRVDLPLLAPAPDLIADRHFNPWHSCQDAIQDMATSSWALSQLSQILPLDELSLKEILEYTSTLSKDAAAEHLRNLLGTSPKALEFISSYNSRREPPKSEAVIIAPETSEPSRRPRKKKQPLNKPFAIRQPEDYGNVQGAYRKRDEDDYVAANSRSHKESALASTLALSEIPDAQQLPLPESKGGPLSPKKPPSAFGPLISDLPHVRTGSRFNSRTSSPAPKTKVSITGGKSMHGASSTLQDLVSSVIPLCLYNLIKALPRNRQFVL